MDFVTNFMLLDTNSYLKLRLLKRCKNVRVKKKNLKRKGTLKEFYKFFQRLLNCPDDFYELTKMRSDTFFYILNSIRHQLLTNSNYRENITPEEKLFITLRYLSSGVSFRYLALQYGLDIYTPGEIINETCSAICNELFNRHLPYPTEEFFYKTSKEYELLYNFPNCIGCIDCKYIRRKNQNLNDLPTYLQVIADANYKLISAEVITSDHDEIFSSSVVFNCLERKTYGIPPPIKIPQMNAELPFVLLGGKGYQLKKYLLRPYKLQNNKKEEEELFNKKVIETRQSVEHAFGILISKWACLTTELQSNFTDKIVKASCVLHNVVIDLEGIDKTTLSNLKDFRNRIGVIRTSRQFSIPDKEGIFVRTLFKQYINGKYLSGNCATKESKCKDESTLIS